MTSYHEERENLLVTSPTCRQLGIRRVNITQQLLQQAATTTHGHKSSARNNDDNAPSLTPVVSAADVVDDDDDDDDESDTYDNVSLQYGTTQIATNYRHPSRHFHRNSMSTMSRDAPYCHHLDDVIDSRDDVIRDVVLPTAFVRRRNERERQRVRLPLCCVPLCVWSVRCVNEGFERLRQRVPATFMRGRSGSTTVAERRVSKVETLRAAVRYIRHLTTILAHHHHRHHYQDHQQQQLD